MENIISSPYNFDFEPSPMDENLTKRAYRFMEKYKDNYEPEIRNHIYSELALHTSNMDNMDIVDDPLFQIYTHCGILDEICYIPDHYKESINNIRTNYDINRSLLDVGCGYYPAFAEKLHKYQNTGCITCIDPNLVVKEVKGLKLIKSEFDLDFDLSKYDMIYGIMPCNATLSIIRAANQNDKDLYIQMCGCIHDEELRNMAMYSFDYRAYQYYLEKWIDIVTNEFFKTMPSTRTGIVSESSVLKYPILRTQKK